MMRCRRAALSASCRSSSASIPRHNIGNWLLGTPPDSHSFAVATERSKALVIFFAAWSPKIARRSPAALRTLFSSAKDKMRDPA